MDKEPSQAASSSSSSSGPAPVQRGGRRSRTIKTAAAAAGRPHGLRHTSYRRSDGTFSSLQRVTRGNPCPPPRPAEASHSRGGATRIALAVHKAIESRVRSAPKHQWPSTPIDTHRRRRRARRRSQAVPHFPRASDLKRTRSGHLLVGRLPRPRTFFLVIRPSPLGHVRIRTHTLVFFFGGRRPSAPVCDFSSAAAPRPVRISHALLLFCGRRPFGRGVACFQRALLLGGCPSPARFLYYKVQAPKFPISRSIARSLGVRPLASSMGDATRRLRPL